MNTKKFSDAMSELDNKYVDEAINYQKETKRPVLAKLGVLVACLCAIVIVAIPIIQHSNYVADNEPQKNVRS